MYMCSQQKGSHINDTPNKEVYTTQVRTSVHVYCAHAAGVSRESTKRTSDKQQTMQANLVNGLYIKSTGLHEVVHYGQLTKIGCKMQGGGSVIIRIKEVALHLGGQVLSNGKMAFNGTQKKGISTFLHRMIGQAHNRSQPVHTCMVHRRGFNAPLSNTMPRCVQHTYYYTHHIRMYTTST